MSRLREPRAAGPATARALRGGTVLLVGPTGRAALLSASEHAAFARGLDAADPLRERLAALGAIPGAADAESLARETIESGLLNWPGPRTHAVVVSANGESMLPEMAKGVVDFVFSTPRPTVFLELVDRDRTGWPAASFAAAYARRRAEWSGRGLALSYRTPSAPSAERAEYLRGHGAAVRAELRADGAPGAARLFSAARARVLVGAGAKDPEGWVDALASQGVSGVEWVASGPKAEKRRADFAARALARMLETHETSDLRDETALGLLNARPWEVLGADLAETLAYAPDGTVFTSEEGWALEAEGGGDSFRLGHASTLRFAELPSVPVVPAVLTALSREVQPLCAACAYRSYCLVPPSVHERAQGSLTGRLPDSPRCIANMALLDAVFSRLNEEKCLKALEKWGVDISRLTC